MITIIHNPACSKSRISLEYLQELNEEILVRDYLDVPLSVTELEDIIHKLGIMPQELLRKKEPLYKELFENKKLTDKQVINLMANNPILIERPIIIKEDKAVIARPLEKLKDFIK